METQHLLAKMTHWSLEERDTQGVSIEAMMSRLKHSYREEYRLEVGEGSKRSKGALQMSTIAAVESEWPSWV